MAKKCILSLAILFGLASHFLATALVLAAEVPRMTTEELKRMMGNPDVVIVDTRSDSDWQQSDEKIKGSVRENPQKVDWINKYSKDRTLVFYCA